MSLKLISVLTGLSLPLDTRVNDSCVMVVGRRIFYVNFFFSERRMKKLVEEAFLLNGLSELAVSPHVF